MKKVVLGLFVAAAVLMGAASAQAQVIKLSLWGDICVPNEDYTGGLELGIGSQTKAVDGVQLGIIYSQTNKLQGVQIGLINSTKEEIGVQFGLVNITESGIGFQEGLVNIAQNFKGEQYGCINWTSEDLIGLQFGLLDVIKGTGKGAQIGVVNYATEFKGLQLGVVNWAKTINGVQVGLINVIENKPNFLPVFVIFNFGF